MEDKLEEKLQEIYKNINIEVKYEDIRTYAIYTRIEYREEIYESKFIYKYDNKLTFDVNIDSIKEIINNIILSFYIRGEEDD